jgi:hypothetical protein
MSVVPFHNKSTRKKEPESITGRDAEIVGKALAYAIEVIAALPYKYQERSDRRDMQRIFDAILCSWGKDSVTYDACRHLFHPGSPLIRNANVGLIADDPDAF